MNITVQKTMMCFARIMVNHRMDIILVLREPVLRK